MKNTVLYVILFALGVLAASIYWRDQAAPNLETQQTPAVVQAPASLATGGVFSYAEAVKRAKPAVVNINTSTVVTERRSLFDDPIFNYFFGDRLKPRQRTQTSLGSGVLVSAQGYVLTNHHVIKNADKIKVSLNDGRSAQAKLIGADIDTDIAVLKIDLEDLPAVVFGDSDLIQVGDVSLAIGNPFGVGQTVTMGIVSATGRSQLGISNLENFIQTDAAINPGNSGGALINARGELIGINTAIFSRSGASHGIGFAVPAAMAKAVLQGIVEDGKVVRGWLGVETQDLTPRLAQSFGLQTQKGVVVTGVYNNSPADHAGLRPGDVMVRLDDEAIHNAVTWKRQVLLLKPGKVVQIEVIREATPVSLTLKVGERPARLAR